MEPSLEQLVPFGSAAYWVLLCGVLGARAMDFLSTWVATPNLELEANPIARKLGWKAGLLVNVALSPLVAMWPLPSVVIITTSLLVAARNFQSAWLMRSLGEDEYRAWMGARLAESPRNLFALCLVAQTGLLAVVGGGLMWFSQWRLVPFGVGLGIVTYAAAILVYTSLSVWRSRMRPL